MPYYRIYFLDAERQLVAVQEAVFPDDDAALTKAATMIEPYAGAEVWCELRQVGNVPSPQLGRK